MTSRRCVYCRRDFVDPKACSHCAGRKKGVKKTDIERGLEVIFDRIEKDGRCSAFYVAAVVMHHTGFPRKTADEITDNWIDRGILRTLPNETFEKKGTLVTWTPVVLGPEGERAVRAISRAREVKQ